MADARAIRARLEAGPDYYDRWLFLGSTGAGKSYEIKELVENHWRRPIAIFDPQDEYSPHTANRFKPGFRLGALRQRVTVPEFMAMTGRQQEDLLCQQHLSLAIVPQTADLAERGKVWAEQFCDVAPKLEARGDLIVGLEELGLWALETVKAERTINALACGSAKFGVAMIMGAQFMTQAPEASRGQLTLVSSGLQVKASHLDFLARETTAEYAERVAGLDIKRHERAAIDLRQRQRGRRPDRSKRGK